MQVASFIGLVKALFYMIAFYYIFRFLAKLFLPLILKKVVEKAGQKMQQQQKDNWKKTQTTDEVIYKNANSKNPKETKKVGDYVDYEEID
jgi:hypothetical protein